MAFGRKKKEEVEAAPGVEEAEIIVQPNSYGQLTEDDINQGGEHSMEAQPEIWTPAEEAAKRTRVMVKDRWVDKPTAAAFEEVRAKIGPGTSERTVTDHFFGEPTRIHTELPEPPQIESYSAAEIGAKVKAALLANL